VFNHSASRIPVLLAFEASAARCRCPGATVEPGEPASLLSARACLEEVRPARPAEACTIRRCSRLRKVNRCELAAPLLPREQQAISPAPITSPRCWPQRHGAAFRALRPQVAANRCSPAAAMIEHVLRRVSSGETSAGSLRFP